MINIFLGSVFFVTISSDISSLAKWSGALFALVAAALSGVVTFFNFNKLFEGHSRLANRYLALAQECQRLKAQFEDSQISLGNLSKELKMLNIQYQDVNSDAEGYPLTSAAFPVALKKEKLRQEGLSIRYGKAARLDKDESIQRASKIEEKQKGSPR